MSSTPEEAQVGGAAAIAPRSAFAQRVAAVEHEEESTSNELGNTDTPGFNFNSLALTAFKAVHGDPNPHNNNVFFNPAGGFTTLRMKMGEQLVILGEYRFRVTRGQIRMYGALVCPESGTITVHAPLTHGLPVILCHLASGCDIDLFQVTSDSMRPFGHISTLFAGIWKCQSTDQAWFSNPSFRLVSTSS
jgi:hypothetical protein